MVSLFSNFCYEKMGKSVVKGLANLWVCAVADTLDRCEVPFFGKLASRILDDE